MSMKITRLKDLPIDEQQLISEAEDAMAFSYSPYSKFVVGVALKTDNGAIFRGTNFETNAHDSICAEQAAIATANTAGARKFQAMAVISNDPKLISPCGQCRQFLTELVKIQNRDFPVIMASTQNDKIRIMSASELLPESFE